MRIFLSLVFVALSGTAIAATIALNPYWGVIFPAAQAPQLARQCSRDTPHASGVWQPTPTDIARLEAGLTSLLVQHKVQPGAYYRQYGGLIVAGRRIVYVNGARNAVVHGDWRTVPISICDGGALAFGVEYDPASGQFTNFAFNGHL